MLLKCCTQYVSKFGKLSSGHRTGKGVFTPIPKKGNAKECSSYHTIALISHARKVMLKILQARLQWYTNRELPDVQAGFRKGRGTREQIASIGWIIGKTRVPEKHPLLLYWLRQSLWWITTNCEKFFKRWEYRRREQTELDSVLGQAVNIRLHTWPPSQWTLNFVPSVYRNGMPMENQTPGQKSLRTWTWTLCCLKEYANYLCNRTKS